MIDWGVFIAGCAGMALLAAAVDGALPRSRRSWWRAQARAEFSPRQARSAATETALPAIVATERVELQLVATDERRQNGLPFVGKDRRRAARAAVRQRRAAGDR